MGSNRAVDGIGLETIITPAPNEDSTAPPPRLYERLRQFSGYDWDESRPPIHTPNDIWLVCGTRFTSVYSTPANTNGYSSRISAHRAPNFSSQTPDILASPPTYASDIRSDHSSPPPIQPTVESVRSESIVARVTYNVFREERNFQIAKSVTAAPGQDTDYIVKPLDFLRLNPQPNDRGAIIVTIYEDPGENDIMETMDLGPAYYTTERIGDQLVPYRKDRIDLGPPVTLQYFLDFAIGAASCLEALHHKHQVVHGEIRGDSFHYNVKENKVKISVFGSGIKFFEHGLYGSTWNYYLSHGLGARNRLLYISPEQTGRMSVEPDTRTDIYSLGIVFWTMLTRKQAFEGENVIEIVQSILRHRIPDVSQIRMDVPQSISDIIQKCTAKAVGDRYNSASGLRFDLQEVQKILVDKGASGLHGWKVGTRDASSLFTLPSAMIGRDAEREALQTVVERVASGAVASGAMSRSVTSNPTSSSTGPNELSSNNSTQGPESLVDGGCDFSSENGSCSLDEFSRFSSSVDSKRISGTAMAGSAIDSMTCFSESSSRLRPWERNQAINGDTISVCDSIGTGTIGTGTIGTGTIGTGTGDMRLLSADASNGALPLHRASLRRRRGGQCEVVTIEGAAGLGKSLLVQSVMTDMRKRGYCATGKFDNARRTAFGPLLKLLSSLFKQVWGERNTETPFHQALRGCVGPIWPQLHLILGLPSWLLNPDGVPRSSSSLSNTSSRQGSPPALGLTVPTNLAAIHSRRGSSPISAATASPLSATSSSGMATAAPIEIIKGTSTGKAIRMVNVVLDVLCLFSSYKFLCICLDDLHFADDESLDLITQIISAKIRMVVIMTYRPDEISAERVHSLIHPTDCEDCTRPGPIVTKIRLNALKEDDIIEYVASTLLLSKSEVHSLAMVIQSKCAGNPFYMREMLTACHQKQCISYNYKAGRWKYELDKIYENFHSDQDYDVLDTGFITQRLCELSPATRAILTWASLLGNTFSFQLICHLLSGEFIYQDKDEDQMTDISGDFNSLEMDLGQMTPPSMTDADHEAHVYRSYSQEEAIAGLNTAIQASILIPSEVDDRFRFAHDRYVQAAMAMKSCSLQKMHFVIAQTLHKYYGEDERLRDTIASHVCEAVDVMRKRVTRRRVYRNLLCDCARIAAESGARPTAAKLYTTAVSLLQSDPWADDDVDRSYHETWELHLKAADCSLYLGHHARVVKLLGEVLKHGRTPIEKAPGHVLKSRMLSQIGDADSALASLKLCVDALGVTLDTDPTFEKCDHEFYELQKRLAAMDYESIVNMASADPSTFPQVGMVMAEALITAWWSNQLVFYNLALVTVNMHLTCGYFPQAGLAFILLGMLAVAHLDEVAMGVKLGDIGTALLSRGDPEDQLINRGWMMYYKFISHLREPISFAANNLERISNSDANKGNFMAELVSFGLTAMLKMSLGEDCDKLEAWCTECVEDMPGWDLDTRGGTIILAVRQAARALQGKTTSADEIECLSDESHQTSLYKQWIQENIHNGGRSLLVYETIELLVLVFFGHFHRAVEVGKRCVDRMNLLWSARANRQSLLFYSWALTTTTLEKVHDETGRYSAAEVKAAVKAAIVEIEKAIKKIEVMAVVEELNYKHWIFYMRGFVKELQNRFGDAIRLYEVGIEHSLTHFFPLEEAIGHLLMCSLLERREAPWLASRSVHECLSLLRNCGAYGVAAYLEKRYEKVLLRYKSRPRAIDAGVQTDAYLSDPHINIGYSDKKVDNTNPHRPLPAHRSTHSRADSNHRNPIVQPPAPSEEMADETKPDTLNEQWRMKDLSRGGAAGLPELDIIDLQAILRSSHSMSSILQIDELLVAMCDIILQTCGSATLVGIITRDHKDNNWVLAASGSPESQAEAHIPGLPLESAGYIAENVIHYCTRFREEVFVDDIMSEERFGNLNQAWIELNPTGKAIIAIPIQHGEEKMHGVLYIEGNPSTFTNRNAGVLRLLVNQIGISYNNALAMKKLRKATAETLSASEVQQKALEKARDAEGKARKAEAKARKAEEKAKRNVKLAEEAARAKSSFLANVSHELRTPLNGVIGNTDLLSRENLDKEQKDIAEAIRVSADLLLAVINDLLDFSRIEAEKMQLHIQDFKPAPLLGEIIRASRFTNKDRKNVTIVDAINLPDDLEIMGDNIRLHQVLGNLISNSSKFTEQGTITVGAEIQSETETSCTLGFWVVDTGIGIEADVLPRLFQPFSQADNSTSRAHGGSGLGLSICKSLVQNVMGGKINLFSKPMEGTRVEFSIEFQKYLGSRDKNARADSIDPSNPGLPPNLQRNNSDYTPADAAASTPPPPHALALAVVPTGDVRVCVAEDNAINQRIAVQFLRRLGYMHIDTYDNGQLAIDGLRRMAAARKPYHLVLMDMQMPVLDGYSATKVIRKEALPEVRDVLIIAMTASAIHGDREKCLSAGMNDYLAKPVKSDQLKKKINAYIKMAQWYLQAGYPGPPADGDAEADVAVVEELPVEGKAVQEMLIREKE